MHADENAVCSMLRTLRGAHACGMCRPTVFLHTYNDSTADVRSNSAPPDEWEALEPFSHSATDQDAVLQEYRCRAACCGCLKFSCWPLAVNFGDVPSCI